MALTLTPVVITGFVIYTLVRTYFAYRKLSHFKGPPIAAFTSLWLANQAISARMNVAQKEALRIYGATNRHWC